MALNLGSRLDWMNAAHWLWVAVVAGSVACVIELARIHAGAAGEIGLGARPLVALWGGHLFAQAVLVAVGCAGWWTGHAVGLAMPRFRLAAARWSPPLLWIVLAAWPALHVGMALGAGPWISNQPWAPIVRLGPLVAVSLAAPVCARAAFATPGAREAPALWVGSVVAVAVLVLVDHRVFPGHYPEFHLFAYAGSAVALLLTVHRTLSGRVSANSWRTTLATAIAAAAMLIGPASWFGMNASTRGTLALRSPTAREWIRLGMPNSDQGLLRVELGDLDPNAGELAWDEADALPRGLIAGREGYNVLFVVVDALRADTLPPVRPPDGTPFAGASDTPFLDAWIAGAYRFAWAYGASTQTHRAMPTLFKSVEIYDAPAAGTPLAVRMERLGLTPVATINEYFLIERHDAVATLTEGFEAIDVYEKVDPSVVVPRAIEMIDSVADRQFFAWVHVYNMHDPGFDGQRWRRDATPVEIYREQLVVLDGLMAELFGHLERTGLADRTIIVLTADHGEGLGDHGHQLHGPTVFDEEVHVPLVVAVPGMPGARVDELVGAVDVVPTLLDLLGAPVDPLDRGRSLVPLMVGHDVEPRSYYFENDSSSVVGQMTGRTKLIYDREAQTYHRFDLDADPDERRDEHDPDHPYDRLLMGSLLRRNPALFADDLEDPGLLTMLGDRLREVDAGRPGAALPFLLALAALAEDRAVIDAALGVMRDSDDAKVKLLVLRSLWSVAPTECEELLGQWLEEIEQSPREPEVIAALARQGQPVAAARHVSRRMRHFAEHGEPAGWEPWLQLVRPWSKGAQHWAPALRAMLDRSAGFPNAEPRVVQLVLQNVTSLRDARGDKAAVLVTAVERLVRHEDPRVRAASLRALASLRGAAAAPTLLARLEDDGEDVRVRREAATALAHELGEDAVTPLVAVAGDEALTSIAIQQLRLIGSPKALGFLEPLARTHYNGYTRRAAASAVKHIVAKARHEGK